MNIPYASAGKNGKINRPAGASHLPDRPNRNGSSEDRAMAKRQLPSPEVLRQLLRYEPETGKLFWKERGQEWFPAGTKPSSWNKRLAGKEAAWASDQGYKRITVCHVAVGAHRAAWAIHYGEWPAQPIDHIDGDRANNRISNLRVVPVAENNRNCARRKDNRSGIAGVYYSNTFNRWKAEVRLNGRKIALGTFSTREEAVSARQKANASLPFSERHGK